RAQHGSQVARAGRGLPMKRLLPIVLAALVAASALHASGPLGIYGIVEKVVFEPNEVAAERVQLWGAFAYVDGVNNTGTVSSASRGYLYFRLPDGGRDVD